MREREGRENDSYVFVLSKKKNRVALYRELAGGVRAGGQENRSRSGQQEPTCGHITSETSLSHPSGGDKLAVGFMTLLVVGVGKGVMSKLKN